MYGGACSQEFSSRARARNEKGGQVRVDANYTRLPASVRARAREINTGVEQRPRDRGE